MKLRGWDVHELSNHLVAVTVVPGKGGDIVSIRWLPTGEDVLFATPWGLRQQGSLASSMSSVAGVLEAYPGGWQSVFPNGGDPCLEGGIEWGMHGEAWTAPWDIDEVLPQAILMSTRLVRSPFEMRKRVALSEGAVTVTETVRNVGRRPVEVMWSQHPALGRALVGPQTHITTSGRRFAVDDKRRTDNGDLLPGWQGVWPDAMGKDGSTIDLSLLPAEGAAVERLGYLSDFDGIAWVELVNEHSGLKARLSWDAQAFPHAWYWLEAHASMDFPWYGAVYVLAIEPATSWPAQGIGSVRASTGTQVTIEPGQMRESQVTLSIARENDNVVRIEPPPIPA